MKDPIGILGIATARAQDHLRQMMVFISMFPVNQPEVMIGNCADKFDEQGDLTDESSKGFIRDLLQNLIDRTRRIQ
jgi:chromate reductase